MTLVPIRPAGPQADSFPAAGIPAGYAQQIRNLLFRQGRWRRRTAISPLFAQDFADALIGAWAMKVSPAATGATYDLFAGSAGSASASPAVCKLVGAGLVALPNNGVSLAHHAGFAHYPWRPAKVRDDTTFLARRGMATGPAAPVIGRLLHQTAFVVTPAGIPAPAAAPTVTDSGVAGALPAGTWNVPRYAYVSVDGSVGNASPAGAAVTTLANRKRRWALVASTHPRVNRIRLYLPLVGANNEAAYWIGTDAPNVTGNYDEDVLDAAFLNRSWHDDFGEPPLQPEDVCVWDERLFVTCNLGGPAWHHTTIDEDGPQWEAYDSSRVLRLPPRGGLRAQTAVPWDASDDNRRLALFTDGCVGVATPTNVPDAYAIDMIDPVHGIPGQQCAAAADGVLAWFTGREFVVSRGGKPEVVSSGWVDKALANVPGAYAERAVVTYRAAEGGYFTLAIPSTSSSTSNDLELQWSPRDGWNEADYHRLDGAGVAPNACGRIPPGFASPIGVLGYSADIATFHGRRRVWHMDAGQLRDRGLVTDGLPVHVKAILSPVPNESDGTQVVVGRVMFGYDQRQDVEAKSPTEPTLSVSLRLDNGRETTPVTATKTARGRYFHARAENLGDPAEFVQVVIEGDMEQVGEVFDVQADAAAVGLRIPA